MRAVADRHVRGATGSEVVCAIGRESVVRGAALSLRTPSRGRARALSSHSVVRLLTLAHYPARKLCEVEARRETLLSSLFPSLLLTFSCFRSTFMADSSSPTHAPGSSDAPVNEPAAMRAPDEVWHLVLEELDYTGLHRMAGVSKRLQRLVKVRYILGSSHSSSREAHKRSPPLLASFPRLRSSDHPGLFWRAHARV